MLADRVSPFLLDLPSLNSGNHRTKHYSAASSDLLQGWIKLLMNEFTQPTDSFYDIQIQKPRFLPWTCASALVIVAM